MGPGDMAAEMARDACACGLLTSGAGAAWDSGEHRCYGTRYAAGECYTCGHVKVSDRPTCPVTGCNGRGPREVGGCVVLASSGPSDLHLRVPAPEACATCGDVVCVCWPVAPSPAECVGDAARAELQALAEALNRTAPIVDVLPFTLRGEVKQDDGRRPARLPF